MEIFITSFMETIKIKNSTAKLQQWTSSKKNPANLKIRVRSLTSNNIRRKCSQNDNSFKN